MSANAQFDFFRGKALIVESHGKMSREKVRFFPGRLDEIPDPGTTGIKRWLGNARRGETGYNELNDIHRTNNGVDPSRGDMDSILGDYQERPEEHPQFLHLAFYPGWVPLRRRWRNNGLSAEFLADYLVMFYPDEAAGGSEDIRGTLSHIANELLENAMKYNDEALNYPINLYLLLDPGLIRLYVSNQLTAEHEASLRAFIADLDRKDPQDFYLELIERAAASPELRDSGMGLLGIQSDFQARLGWKFETSPPESSNRLVTTLARIPW